MPQLSREAQEVQKNQSSQGEGVPVDLVHGDPDGLGDVLEVVVNPILVLVVLILLQEKIRMYQDQSIQNLKIFLTVNVIVLM